VLVGEVVGINHLGLGRHEDSLKVVRHISISRILDGAAGVIKEDVGRVLTDESSFLLFFAPDDLVSSSV
jgi:hypothetical protein